MLPALPNVPSRLFSGLSTRPLLTAAGAGSGARGCVRATCGAVTLCTAPPTGNGSTVWTQPHPDSGNIAHSYSQPNKTITLQLLQYFSKTKYFWMLSERWSTQYTPSLHHIQHWFSQESKQLQKKTVHLFRQIGNVYFSLFLVEGKFKGKFDY